MSDAQLKLIDVDNLTDHPSNPRVAMREDVIEGIVQNLGDSWPQKHALSVREFGDGYQVISGHHRKQAAIKKGIKQVWCWVEEMDDETAFMELVTNNNQGELDPLEIGIHAFEAVPVSKGGRGKKGGLSEYAERIGKDKGEITKYRQAGEVCKALGQPNGLMGKAQHLSAIHKLPKEYWQEATTTVIEKEMSVADVKECVKRALEFTKPKCDCDDYFNGCLIYVFNGSLSQKTANQLCETANRVSASLPDDLREDWHQFLTNGEGRFNFKTFQDERIELETILFERESQTEEEKEEVTVLVADPPWRYDFAETESRQIENQYPTADAEEIAKHLELPWAPKIADDCVLFMWATAPKLQEAFIVLDGWGFEYKTHAVWDKEKIGMGYWFRGQHELLIVATRGKKSPPEASNRFSSMFREKRDSKHSKKPQCVYEAIEAMFPKDVKFEMYCREPRKGWEVGGNEST